MPAGVVHVAGVVAGLAFWLSATALTLAASPTPPPAGGDPRSPGQGPGLVGDPLFAVLVVVGIGVVSVVGTLAYIRLTADRGG